MAAASGRGSAKRRRQKKKSKLNSLKEERQTKVAQLVPAAVDEMNLWNEFMKQQSEWGHQQAVNQAAPAARQAIQQQYKFIRPRCAIEFD